MLRTLLAERFKLKFRIEQREKPGYVLTVAPEGLKMPKADEFVPMSGRRNHEEGALPMEGIVGLIQTALGGAPVVDQTQLTGTYRVVLDYSQRNAAILPGGAPADPDPDIVAAARKQLGLKLEPKKVPVDFMIVESVERAPVAN